MLVATSANAQGSVEWAFNGAPQAATLHSSAVLQNLAYESAMRSAGVSLRSAPRSSARSAPTTSWSSSAAAVAPAKLAQAYPLEARPQAEAAFRQTLAAYRAVVQKLGAPPDDPGTALAAFVAGNYSAARDEPFPDEWFSPLAAQLKRALEPRLTSLSAAERQELCEQLAILGTFMVAVREGLQQQPNPMMRERLRQAARRNLEQTLGLEFERLRLSAEGLRVADGR